MGIKTHFVDIKCHSEHSNLSDATKFTKPPHLVYFVYRMSLNDLVCWLKQVNLVFCVFCDLLCSFSSSS